MLLYEGPHWSQVVDPYIPEHETPCGYDFTLGRVYRIAGRGTIARDDRILPDYRELDPYQYYYLGPHMYIVEFNEMVSIPPGYVGLMWPRSTLLRCGASLQTAIWDPGYTGVSKTTLVVHNPEGIKIEPSARIGHMILVKLDTFSRLYSGQYQGEGISS